MLLNSYIVRLYFDYIVVEMRDLVPLNVPISTHNRIRVYGPRVTLSESVMHHTNFGNHIFIILKWKSYRDDTELYMVEVELIYTYLA